MKTFERRVTLLLTVLLTLWSLTACLKEKDKEVSSRSNQYSLNVVTSATSALSNPLVQVAKEKGYFCDYGLSVKETPLEMNGVFEALSIGKVDTTYSQLIPPLSYGAQGADVELYAGTISGGMCVITTKEKAEELEDLKNWKGKNIGVIQLSTSEMVTKYVLGNKYNYKKGTDINYTLIENYPAIVLAVSKGTIDVGFVSSEYLESALDQGLEYLFPLTAVLENYVCCRQTAYKKSFEENRDAYVAYLKGQIRAYKDLTTDEDGTVKSLVKETGETDDYIRTYVYDYEANANRKYNPDPNYNGTLAVYETLLDWEYVEDGIELSTFYDLSVYAQALNEIIKEHPQDTFYKDMWTFFEENNNNYPNFEETFKRVW
ncbi:ABC transporter substrate-binding protein [Anaerosporobacter sp.]